MKEEVKLVKKVKRFLKRLGCPRWLHHFGPKKYEFSVHLVALLLKEVFRLSFRRAAHLLGMFGKIPSYSALCKMRKRIPLWLWEKFLQLTAPMQSTLIAVDATGMSRSNPSWHFIKRIDRKKPVKCSLKLSVFFDTREKKFCALRLRAKPRHDTKDVEYLFKRYGNMKTLLGDTAYDAEWIHEMMYLHHIRTVIKPRKNVHRGHYRRKQMEQYCERTYHRRSMVESGFGSLKRKYGSYLLARALCSQRAEVYCRAIAHNLHLRSQETFN